MAQSTSIEADKLPKFMIWLDGHTLLLADAVSSIWAFEYSEETSEISLKHTGRLATKGIFALQRDQGETGSFWIGNKDACCSYRLCGNGSELEVKLLGSNCLHYGVVKEVGCMPPNEECDLR